MTGFLPGLSVEVQTVTRAAYGALMALTLLQALPEWRRFFLSERWGGYTRSSRTADAIQNPWVVPPLIALWLIATVSIAAGWAAPWPALVNLLLCRYFFVQARWTSVLRGMGAPGFLAYWLGAAVFLLDFTTRFAPQTRSLAVLVLQVDFALIMLSAGVYKFTAGYRRNHGMELGLCNPMWGYWWQRYLAVPPGHWVYWTLNQLAWTTEVVAAVLMLLPPTRELGGLIIAASFIFILTHIRLGFLCEMVIVASLLFVADGGAVDAWMSGLVGERQPLAASTATGALDLVLAAALAGYLVLLPLAHAGLYVNFYARTRLPRPLQTMLERYTNTFGIIIWRVFSVDLINFFIRIYVQPADGPRVPAGRLGAWPRFNHVGEMICLTSLFTTLKYYPGDDPLFRERLLRYARTVPRPPQSTLVFEYVAVRKGDDRTQWLPAAEFRVDVDAGTVTEHVIDPAISLRAAHPGSPVYGGVVPGSYAPAPR